MFDPDQYNDGPPPRCHWQSCGVALIVILAVGLFTYLLLTAPPY